ncbi:hypothetical protein [Propylenella binzhouense]|uniref:hypothetical protein n=1 Tax=Propylenella binzhouense TaxID=2555902 RepID=UPI00136CFD48|nr:hypothetical protein [Propylenella binzhouense]
MRLQFLLAAAALSAPLPALAADLAVAVAPAPAAIAAPSPCADAKVAGTIMDRFAWAEQATWHRGYVISRLDYPRERPDAYRAFRTIPTQFCEATALMTDGTTRTVYYTIEIQQGLASIGRGVDYCVLGLDPWHVHDAACRTVR